MCLYLKGFVSSTFFSERNPFFPTFSEALSPAFIHGAAAAATAAELWPHQLSYANAAAAEQQLQLHQQALLGHPAFQQQLPVRSFL